MARLGGFAELCYRGWARDSPMDGRRQYQHDAGADPLLYRPKAVCKEPLGFQGLALSRALEGRTKRGFKKFMVKNWLQPHIAVLQASGCSCKA